MKTTSLKAIMILSGSMLIGTQTMQAAINNDLSNFVSKELNNFSIQGLYVIVGVVAASLAFYFLSNRFLNEEKPMRQSVSYSQQRRHHHRAVIKKTA